MIYFDHNATTPLLPAAREAWLDIRLSELDDAERETLSRAAEIIDRMAGQPD